MLLFKKVYGLRYERNLKKFFSIVFSIVGGFILVAIFFLLSYNFFTKFINTKDIDKKNTNENQSSIIDKIFLPPKKTKFLVLGLDQNELLADSIFVGCFERDTHKINIV